MQNAKLIRNRRTIGAGILLSILIVCAFIGTRERTVSVARVPVSKVDYSYELQETDSVQSALDQREQDRTNELAMLQSVIENPLIPEETRNNAAEQLVELTDRLERETRISACLEEIGFKHIASFCGANGISLVCSAKTVAEDVDRMRLIDAVCGVTGCEAGDIKIIITKK